MPTFRRRSPCSNARRRTATTGSSLADSKFMRWDTVAPQYAGNARKVRDACRRLGLEFIPCVFDIGYCGRTARARPQPRRRAAGGGRAVRRSERRARSGRRPGADPQRRLRGAQRQHAVGLEFVDMPGKISFIDTDVKYEGKPSLRMQDIGANDPQHGHGRASPAAETAPLQLLSPVRGREDAGLRGRQRGAHRGARRPRGRELELLRAGHPQNPGLASRGHRVQQPGVFGGDALPGRLGRQGRARSGGPTRASSRPGWSTSCAATARRCA